MRHIHGALAALLVCGLAVPAAASPRQAGQDVPRTPATTLLDSTAAPAVAPQTVSVKAPSQARRLLISTLVGAGIGAALVGVMAYGLRDCGNCDAGIPGAMAQGAFYGGLIGAAIGAIPVRGPHPSRGRAAITPTVTPRVKAVSVAVGF